METPLVANNSGQVEDSRGTRCATGTSDNGHKDSGMPNLHNPGQKAKVDKEKIVARTTRNGAKTTTKVKMVARAMAKAMVNLAASLPKESPQKVSLGKAERGQKVINGLTTGQDSTDKEKSIAKTTICAGHATTTNVRGPISAPNKVTLDGYAIKITKLRIARSSSEGKLNQRAEYLL